jgi:ubiquinone/menaquinone biosynthesis C-methylase UbiE
MVWNNRHYYDGRFYKKLIDPSLKDVRNRICDLVEEKSRVVDIGCGTGALAFLLSRKCRYVAGVDLSKKMTDYARYQKLQNGYSNVSFFHGNGADMRILGDSRFDYATFSMVLHEMPENRREPVLNEAFRMARRLIIADYKSPVPFGFFGLGARIIEFFAGFSHFANFRTYTSNGWLKNYIRKNRLVVGAEQNDKTGVIRIILLSPP